MRQEEDEAEKLLAASDLTSTIKKSEHLDVRPGRKPIGTKISIILPEDLIKVLREAADKRAIGYQTLIRMIVAENIKKYV